MDYFIGYIALFPYNFTPMGWLLCDGRLVTIQQNDALFSLVGHTYGGDGNNTFAIPNMLGLEPIPGMQYYICTQGSFPTRN